MAADLDLLIFATTPEQLFGTDKAAAKKLYRRLSLLCHPDTAPEHADLFHKLSKFWSAYSGEIVTKSLVLHTKRHSYLLDPNPTYEGTVAALFSATETVSEETRLLKIARHPKLADLMDAEKDSLKKLSTHGENALQPYIPTVVETFRHRYPRGMTVKEARRHGIERRVNVLEPADEGFVPLTAVKARYPNGIDPRDAAWMFRRVLYALQYVGEQDIVHGSIVPEHVLILPAQHGVMLVDWCYSTNVGEKLRAVPHGYGDWYPSEVLKGEPTGRDTDIYLAAGILKYLLAADAPKQFMAFINGTRMAKQSQRPDGAHALLLEFDDLLERLYGARKFRPFNL